MDRTRQDLNACHFDWMADSLHLHDFNKCEDLGSDSMGTYMVQSDELMMSPVDQPVRKLSDDSDLVTARRRDTDSDAGPPVDRPIAVPVFRGENISSLDSPGRHGAKTPVDSATKFGRKRQGFFLGKHFVSLDHIDDNEPNSMFAGKSKHGGR